MPGLGLINRIRSESDPLRWAASRLLWTTRLCSAFSVRLPQGPRVRFSPTSISAGLWVDPRARSEELDFITTELKAGDTFIDIGANIGQFALVGAQQVGSCGSVVAIEPHPKIFSYLQKNIELNGFTNVRLVNAAVGAVNGSAYIGDTRNDDMNHIDSSHGIKVRMVTLDSLDVPGPVGLLKMDVEGFEYEVLQAAPEAGSLHPFRVLGMESEPLWP